MSSGIIGIQRLYDLLLAYVKIWESFMSSGMIGIQRLYCFLLAYVTMWESFCVIRNYWNTASVLLFTSICNDMGVILCHPELLEYSVCIAVC